MKILAFDTETTGLFNKKLAPDAPGQPRVVQLAAVLVEAEKEPEATFNKIVKPVGFDIPLVVTKIHGISTERAHAEGHDLSSVIDEFRALVDRADLLVAHNLDFDAFLLRGEFLRLGIAYPSKPACCTMRAATSVCNIPSRWGKPKWPKLGELHRHAFGTELLGAHDALNDVLATAKCYFWLKSRNHI